MAKINLRKFVSEHYKGGITARDVVREAVTNSIHAGAQTVKIHLGFSEPTQSSLQGVESRRVLANISITDDGEGFTAENLKFFDEVCTSHKDAIGGKGVGRLSFLKFAQKVQITSQLEDEFVEFEYNYDFDSTKTLKVEKKGTKETVITISEINKQINTQVSTLVNGICDDLRLILFLKKQDEINIDLSFTHDSEQVFEKIFTYKGSDVIALSQKTFNFSNESFDCYLFKDELPQKGIIAMLCADNLGIEEYAVSKRFDICRYSIFITSKYFNSRANMERQRLEMPQAEQDTDLVSLISREKLIPKIHSECMVMVELLAKDEIDDFKKSNISKLQKYYPYINTESLGGNAKLLDADEMIRTYRQTQARQEDQLIDNLEKGTASIDNITHLAQDDLARYIVHRALVIDSLSKLPNDSIENEIHKAFLPKKSNGNSLNENNIWLLDDKFLSYSSVHSDATMKAIVNSVSEKFESEQQRKPDIAAFFTKDNENLPNKLVIIEFKKKSADVFENNKSLAQCRLYASELVKRIETIREIFAFAIVEIDDEFYEYLIGDGYTDIFSLGARIIYRDYKIQIRDVPFHQYVMPISALLKDAKARNKVFEDILRLESTN